MLVNLTRSAKLIVQFFLKIRVKKKNVEDFNFSMTSYVDCHKCETNTKLRTFFLLSFYTCKSLEIWRFGMHCRALQLWMKVNVSLSSDDVTDNWMYVTREVHSCWWCRLLSHSHSNKEWLRERINQIVFRFYATIISRKLDWSLHVYSIRRYVLSSISFVVINVCSGPHVSLWQKSLRILIERDVIANLTSSSENIHWSNSIEKNIRSHLAQYVLV